MNQPQTLQRKELIEVLNKAIGEKTSAIMTHQAKGKWHMTKVALVELRQAGLAIEIGQKQKRQPLNIQVDQPVGLSLKHGYDKFIFEATVIGFENDASAQQTAKILLKLPERGEKYQRRNFFRVAVPNNMKVKVLFWHRGYHDEINEIPDEKYWQGRLIDVSAGGMQICIGRDKRPNFRDGQLVGLEFTPMPYEKPLLLEGQVRHIAASPKGEDVYLGLQIIGLELNPKGRESLRRLCTIVEYYYQIIQTDNQQAATTAP